MKISDLLIPLLAAVWACGTLVFTVIVEANKVRDKVMLRRDDNGDLTVEHRRMLYKNDWRPFNWLVSVVCIGFSVLAASSPMFIRGEKPDPVVWLVCGSIGAIIFAMGIVWILSAWDDSKRMKGLLDLEGRQESEQQKTKLSPANQPAAPSPAGD